MVIEFDREQEVLALLSHGIGEVLEGLVWIFHLQEGYRCAFWEFCSCIQWVSLLEILE